MKVWDEVAVPLEAAQQLKIIILSLLKSLIGFPSAVLAASTVITAGTTPPEEEGHWYHCGRGLLEELPQQDLWRPQFSVRVHVCVSVCVIHQ